MEQDLTLFEIDGSDPIINEEALEVLKNEKREVVVICAHGKSGAGKSTFLKKVIEETGSSAGFRDPDEIDGGILGIRFWKGDFFDDKSKALILLNTQGIDKAVKTEDKPINKNLFTLSYFLSNVYIWMEKGAIDLNSLSFLRDADHFRSHDSEEVARHAPKFIWAARDGPRMPGGDVTKNFDDKLKHKEGTVSRGSFTGSADEFLLKTMPQIFGEFFPKKTPGSRKCFNTLTIDEDEDSDEEAERAMTAFLGYLKDECRASKEINGFQITGSIFAELAKYFLECLNEDKICMTMTCNDIVKKRVLGDAIGHLEAKLEEVKVKMPMTVKTLENFIRNAREEAKKRILEGSESERQQKSILNSFNTLADEIEDNINVENIERSTEKCEQKFDRYSELEEKAHKGLYETSQELRDEANPMFEDYAKGYDENMGPCRDSVRQKYQDKVGTIKNLVGTVKTNNHFKNLQLDALVDTVESLVRVIGDKAQKKSGLPDTTVDNERALSLFADMKTRTEKEQAERTNILKKVKKE